MKPIFFIPSSKRIQVSKLHQTETNKMYGVYEKCIGPRTLWSSPSEQFLFFKAQSCFAKLLHALEL